MKIKKLIWRDNITGFGKTLGKNFELISNVDRLSLKYYIRNHKYYGSECTDKFFFSSSIMGDDIIECDTVEECKLKAQEHFKNLVLKIYFEEDGNN